MMVYSTAERVCLLEHYFRSGSYTVAREKLGELNPDCAAPSNSTIKRLVDKFRTTGSVADAHRSGRPSLEEERIPEIQDSITKSPTKSVRRLASQTGTPKTSVHRVVRNVLCLYPYKMSVFHALNESDYDNRLLFSEWLLSVIDEEPDFLNRVYWSDEAWFHLSGHVNSQNTRTWSSENPHKFIESPLHSKKIGVWAAMSPNRIFFCFFDQTVNSVVYKSFIDQFVQTLTDQELNYAWFQQDNATAHTSNSSMQLLRESFGERLISKGLFPPRSPDLTPLDFYLWGSLKETVFSDNPKTLEALRANIENGIRNVSGNTLKSVFRNLIRRNKMCIEVNGAHFQHLL